ncbi:MAG: helix-turn-helix transcriptional regulator [Deltaproteobacteria bacterium]|nr:helix-turn-helix transcriptional regulator [Deltaproteobacteria bacterium]
MTLTRELCRAVRVYLGLNQQELARRAGISVSTVRDFERGLRVPVKQNLLALTRYFEEQEGFDLGKLEAAFTRSRI